MKPIHAVNGDIRMIARIHGVTHYQIAECIGIEPEHLSKWMRKELSAKTEKLILNAIHKCSEYNQ